MNHIPFSSIDTFIKEHVRNVLQYHDYKGKDENGDPVYLHTEPYPKITYKATHKIGGTNTSIVYDCGNIYYQSRNYVLGGDADQNGFKSFMNTVNVNSLFEKMIEKYSLDKECNIVIYGEWCGNGIKDKHSISQAKTKQWIIFSIKVNEVTIPNFLELSLESNSIYNVLKWGEFDVTIDYNEFTFGCWKDSKGDLPQYLRDIANQYTLKCPVSEYFGVDGIGEGLVLKNSDYLVKIKNSEYDKVKVEPKKEPTQNPLVDTFLDYALTESRLEQWYNFMVNRGDTLSMKLVVDYQKLILLDIEKECSEYGKDLGIDSKDYESVVRKKSTEYFKKMLIS